MSEQLTPTEREAFERFVAPYTLEEPSPLDAFMAGLAFAARDAVVERPDEGPADDAICRCGHTAHWHAAVIYEDGQPMVQVPQGAGVCDYNSECGCRRFRAVASHPADDALDVIEGLFLAGTDAPMPVIEQERLVERAERVLQANGRKLPAVPAAARLPERPNEPTREEEDAAARAIARQAEPVRTKDGLDFDWARLSPTRKGTYRDWGRAALRAPARVPERPDEER